MKTRTLVLIAPVLLSVLTLANSASAQSELRIGGAVRASTMFPFLPGQSIPGGAVLEFRVGRQFTSRTAIYGELRSGYWTAGDRPRSVFHTSLNGLAEWTPSRFFFLAGGLGLGVFAGEHCLNCSTFATVAAGITFRIGLEIPLFTTMRPDGSSQRHALSVSLDHRGDITFPGDGFVGFALSGSLGVGYEFHAL